jgi:hypothetical protein
MRHALLLLSLAWIGACAPRDPKQTPEGAVMALLEAVERLNQPAYREQAFRLLDEQSRDVLEARARSAESLSHRAFTGPDMFVPSSAIVAFTPERIRGEDVVIEGDRAVITLRGGKPGETARVELVREPDGWHVVLGLEHERPEPPRPQIIGE